MPSEGKTIVLTITRKYFELILSGEKTTEYRKDIAYYDKTFAEKIGAIIFHYRQGRYMHCRIKRIRKISRPDALAKSVFVTTDKCYAIDIAAARIVDRAQNHNNSK